MIQKLYDKSIVPEEITGNLIQGYDEVLFSNDDFYFDAIAKKKITQTSPRQILFNGGFRYIDNRTGLYLQKPILFLVDETKQLLSPLGLEKVLFNNLGDIDVKEKIQEIFNSYNNNGCNSYPWHGKPSNNYNLLG